MPGTLPSTPAPARIQIRSIQPSKVSVAHSMKRSSRSLGAQRFAFRLIYPPMTFARAAVLWAHLMAQRGQFETFQFFLPQRYWPFRGAGGGTPRVNDLAGSPSTGQLGNRSIATDGWPASTTVLLASDFVKFAGHSKVYQQLVDLTTDGTGAGFLTLEPALVAEPADDELIGVGNVPFTVALASDMPEMDAMPRGGPSGTGGKFSLELDLVEAY